LTGCVDVGPLQTTTSKSFSIEKALKALKAHSFSEIIEECISSEATKRTRLLQYLKNLSTYNSLDAKHKKFLKGVSQGLIDSFHLECSVSGVYRVPPPIAASEMLENATDILLKSNLLISQFYRQRVFECKPFENIRTVHWSNPLDVHSLGFLEIDIPDSGPVDDSDNDEVIDSLCISRDQRLEDVRIPLLSHVSNSPLANAFYRAYVFSGYFQDDDCLRELSSIPLGLSLERSFSLLMLHEMCKHGMVHGRLMNLISSDSRDSFYSHLGSKLSREHRLILRVFSFVSCSIIPRSLCETCIDRDLEAFVCVQFKFVDTWKSLLIAFLFDWNGDCIQDMTRIRRLQFSLLCCGFVKVLLGSDSLEQLSSKTKLDAESCRQVLKECQEFWTQAVSVLRDAMGHVESSYDDEETLNHADAIISSAFSLNSAAESC